MQDLGNSQFRNEPCSYCGDTSFEPVVEWWCDGEVVWEGGMAGTTLGVMATPECMRVGNNVPANGAHWGMAFTTEAPSFVVCCLDALKPAASKARPALPRVRLNTSLMRSVSPLTVLLAASLWGCGADDEGESGRVPLEQDMTGSFVDQDFTLSYAIAMSFAPGALTFGETVEEDFGVITSDQPLSCTSDIASDPQEGVYVVIYLKKSVGTHNHHFVEVFRRGPGIHNRWQSNSAEASVATLDTDLITGSVRYEPQGPYEGNDLELLQGNFAAELCDD